MDNFKTLMRVSASIIMFAAASTASAQTNWTGYQVEMFDSETIAIINGASNVAPAPLAKDVYPEQIVTNSIKAAPERLPRRKAEREIETTVTPVVEAPVAVVPSATTPNSVISGVITPADVKPSDYSFAPAAPRADFSHMIVSKDKHGVPEMLNPPACTARELAVRINVTNFKDNKGNLVADLHNHVEDDFLVPEKVLLRVRQAITGDTTSICVRIKTPGKYGIAFYQDKNTNGKFDKNFLGIPKERFGMSNNPRFGLEAPALKDVIFTVPATGADIDVQLKKASDVLKANGR